MIARLVYHWPARLGYWWRVLVGPIPRRWSDGTYDFLPARPLGWPPRTCVTLSESRLTDEEAGILMANQGAPTPPLDQMPPAMREAWGQQWDAIVAEQQRKGAEEFEAWLMQRELGT